MSLINQMLKDLDRREGRSGTGDNAVPEPIPVAPDRRPGGKFLILGAGGAALLLIASLAFWMNQADSPKKGEAEQGLAGPVQTNTESLDATGAPIEEQRESLAEPETVAETPAVFEPQVRENLVQAAPEPESSTPRQGGAASELPQPAAVEVAEETVAHEEQVDAAAGKPLPPIEPVLDTQPEPARSLSKPVKQAASRKESSFSRAQRYLREGRLAEAEADLRITLEQARKNHRARELLAGLLIRGGRDQEAKDLLNEGMVLAPYHAGFALLQARIAMQQGDRSGAVELLEEVLRNGKGNREVVALLAVLYQQQKQHDRALELYRMLVGREPGLPSHWVGAAISLEALGNPEEALAAYRQAVNLPNLAPALRTYANDRIEILGSVNSN